MPTVSELKQFCQQLQQSPVKSEQEQDICKELGRFPAAGIDDTLRAIKAKLGNECLTGELTTLKVKRLYNRLHTDKNNDGAETFQELQPKIKLLSDILSAYKASKEAANQPAEEAVSKPSPSSEPVTIIPETAAPKKKNPWSRFKSSLTHAFRFKSSRASNESETNNRSEGTDVDTERQAAFRPHLANGNRVRKGLFNGFSDSIIFSSLQSKLCNIFTDEVLLGEAVPNLRSLRVADIIELLTKLTLYDDQGSALYPGVNDAVLDRTLFVAIINRVTDVQSFRLQETLELIRRIALSSDLISAVCSELSFDELINLNEIFASCETYKSYAKTATDEMNLRIIHLVLDKIKEHCKVSEEQEALYEAFFDGFRARANFSKLKDTFGANVITCHFKIIGDGLPSAEEIKSTLNTRKLNVSKLYNKIFAHYFQELINLIGFLSGEPILLSPTLTLQIENVSDDLTSVLRESVSKLNRVNLRLMESLLPCQVTKKRYFSALLSEIKARKKVLSDEEKKAFISTLKSFFPALCKGFPESANQNPVAALDHFLPKLFDADLKRLELLLNREHNWGMDCLDKIKRRREDEEKKTFVSALKSLFPALCKGFPESANQNPVVALEHFLPKLFEDDLKRLEPLLNREVSWGMGCLEKIKRRRAEIVVIMRKFNDLQEAFLKKCDQSLVADFFELLFRHYMKGESEPFDVEDALLKVFSSLTLSKDCTNKIVLQEDAIKALTQKLNNFIQEQTGSDSASAVKEESLIKKCKSQTFKAVQLSNFYFLLDPSLKINGLKSDLRQLNQHLNHGSAAEAQTAFKALCMRSSKRRDYFWADYHSSKTHSMQSILDELTGLSDETLKKLDLPKRESSEGTKKHRERLQYHISLLLPKGKAESPAKVTPLYSAKMMDID